MTLKRTLIRIGIVLALGYLIVPRLIISLASADEETFEKWSRDDVLQSFESRHRWLSFVEALPLHGEAATEAKRLLFGHALSEVDGPRKVPDASVLERLWRIEPERVETSYRTACGLGGSRFAARTIWPGVGKVDGHGNLDGAYRKARMASGDAFALSLDIGRMSPEDSELGWLMRTSLHQLGGRLEQAQVALNEATRGGDSKERDGAAQNGRCILAADQGKLTETAGLQSSWCWNVWAWSRLRKGNRPEKPNPQGAFRQGLVEVLTLAEAGHWAKLQHEIAAKRIHFNPGLTPDVFETFGSHQWPPLNAVRRLQRLLERTSLGDDPQAKVVAQQLMTKVLVLRSRLELLVGRPELAASLARRASNYDQQAKKARLNDLFMTEFVQGTERAASRYDQVFEGGGPYSMYRATLALRSGDPKPALKLLKTCTRKTGDYDDCHLLKLRALMLVKPPKATKPFDEYLDSQSDNVRALARFAANGRRSGWGTFRPSLIGGQGIREALMVLEPMVMAKGLAVFDNIDCSSFQPKPHRDQLINYWRFHFAKLLGDEAAALDAQARIKRLGRFIERAIDTGSWRYLHYGGWR